MLEILVDSGFVGILLAIVSVMMWFSFFERHVLVRSHRSSKDHFYITVSRACIVSAPLLGLLGTVDGMITTFNGLQSMQLVSASGGIAFGISRALITTQLGLCIAAPGLLIDRYLHKLETQSGS